MEIKWATKMHIMHSQEAIQLKIIDKLDPNLIQAVNSPTSYKQA